MTTRAQLLHCSNPECPHERLKRMSRWVRDRLPDSATGYQVSDLDFILRNYRTKKLMLLEIKTKNTELKTWQQMLFKDLSESISRGIIPGWTYLGFHIIRFENSFFDDGKVYLDGQLTTEEKVRNTLSF